MGVADTVSCATPFPASSLATPRGRFNVTVSVDVSDPSALSQFLLAFLGGQAHKLHMQVA
jgi:hypothetical protein